VYADIDNFIKAKKAVEDEIKSFADSMFQLSPTFDETTAKIFKFKEKVPSIASALEGLNAEEAADYLYNATKDLSAEEMVLYANDLGMSYDEIITLTSDYVSGLKQVEESMLNFQTTMEEINPKQSEEQKTAVKFKET